MLEGDAQLNIVAGRLVLLSVATTHRALSVETNALTKWTCFFKVTPLPPQ